MLLSKMACLVAVVLGLAGFQLGLSRYAAASPRSTPTETQGGLIELDDAEIEPATRTCTKRKCNTGAMICTFKKDVLVYPKWGCESAPEGSCDSNIATSVLCKKIVTWPNSSCGADGTTPVSTVVYTTNACGL